MKSKNDFGQFRRKIFLRTIAVLAAAAAVIYLTYAVLLRGRFAKGMVALFQNTLGMDYDAALRFYERTFRSHMDAIILLSLLLVASALFYFYLRWLTRYFEDISKGMDALLQDVAGDKPREQVVVDRLNEAISNYTEMNIRDDKTYSLKVIDVQMLVTTYLPEYTIFGVSCDEYTVRPNQINEAFTTEQEQDLPICNFEYLLLYDEKEDRFYSFKA